MGSPNATVTCAGMMRLSYDETVFDAVSRIRLIKLHGSINWYEFSRNNRASPAILLGADPAVAKDGDGKVLLSWSQTPQFIAGGTKELFYQNGIYADLHYRFLEILRRADRIVMSGYGWGDRGISNQLERWIDRSLSNRIILLYEKPEMLAERSVILAEGYNRLVRRRQLIPIGQWLSNTSFCDILPHL
jgi:hypothetical protein